MTRSARRRRVAKATALCAVLAMAACGLWDALALFYAARGPAWLPPSLSLIFAAVLLVCLVLLRRRAGLAAAAGLCAAVLLWWIALVPSNTRDWEPEYARIPVVRRAGDGVVIQNIRNATYEPGERFTPHYREAIFALGQLDEVDLISSHWGDDAIAHVFLSFGFSDGQHLAISVETRRERGEAYSVLGGFFRRYEIIYVAADERDLIGVRSDIRRESVYLYHLVATHEEIERLFLSYMARMESLAQKPEFYNTVTNNCTTNVLQRANAASSRAIPNSWMVLLSGYSDEYIYDLGRMSHSMPFGELKRRSLINRAAGARPGESFSTDIRQDLPE